jgi:hypothetical protein
LFDRASVISDVFQSVDQVGGRFGPAGDRSTSGRRQLVDYQQPGRETRSVFLVGVAAHADEQTSNAYELVPAAAPLVSVPHCGGQGGRETQRIDSSCCPRFTEAEIQVAQTALAQRRAVIEASLLRKGTGTPVAA